MIFFCIIKYTLKHKNHNQQTYAISRNTRGKPKNRNKQKVKMKIAKNESLKYCRNRYLIPYDLYILPYYEKILLYVLQNNDSSNILIEITYETVEFSVRRCTKNEVFH